MATWASGGTVFQSGAGIEGGGTIPSATKLLYRKFELGMARAAPKSRVARGERLNSYDTFNTNGTWDGLTGASPTVTESP